MGTFGSGNFQNDTAGDYLYELVNKMIAEVREEMEGAPASLEADEFGGNSVPCAVELLTVIGKQNFMGFHLPEVSELEEWKTKFMSAWLESIDDLDPDEDYKEERIVVLNKTFDDLITLAKQYQED